MRLSLPRYVNATVLPTFPARLNLRRRTRWPLFANGFRLPSTQNQAPIRTVRGRKSKHSCDHSCILIGMVADGALNYTSNVLDRPSECFSLLFSAHMGSFGELSRNAGCGGPCTSADFAVQAGRFQADMHWPTISNGICQWFWEPNNILMWGNNSIESLGQMAVATSLETLGNIGHSLLVPHRTE